MHYWMIGMLLAVAVFISGCASQPKAVEEAFWAKKDTTVAVVISKLPEEMALFREGGEGLLGAAIGAVEH